MVVYGVAIVVLSAVVFSVIFWAPFDRQYTLIGTVLVLLIPGRVQGLVFREHYRGRRLLAAGQPEAALLCFERFLAQIREKPWQKKFIWCAPGTSRR